MNTAIRFAHETMQRLTALALAVTFTLAIAGGIDRLSAVEAQPMLQAASAPAAHV